MVSKAVLALQVRKYDLVQKDKVFAIGYCFGGGAVLELMRSWPSTPGLLGERKLHSGNQGYHVVQFCNLDEAPYFRTPWAV